MKTFDNTKGMLIDLGKLNTELSKELGQPVAVEAHDTGLLVQNTKGEFGVLGTEIVLRPVDDVVVMPVWEHKEGYIAMFPKWENKMTVAEITEKYNGGEVTVADFVAARRGYNSRLERNEREVTDWLNGR